MKKILWITFVLMILFVSLSAQAPEPKQVMSAKIEDNQINVTYVIPKGMHQTLQEDMFFIDVDDVNGITFEPTVYPKGEKTKDGYTEYHGTVTLSKQFTVLDNFDGKPILKVYAGYQLCLDSGTCFMPEELEFDLKFDEREKSGIPTKTNSMSIAKKNYR